MMRAPVEAERISCRGDRYFPILATVRLKRWPSASGSGRATYRGSLPNTFMRRRCKSPSRCVSSAPNDSPDDTDLPVTPIAERAGFASARRMSAAFAHLYGRPPSALRKNLGRTQRGCRTRRESNNREDGMRPSHDIDPNGEAQFLP
jgi:AraC-like DNA-binding protein